MNFEELKTKINEILGESDKLTEVKEALDEYGEGLEKKEEGEGEEKKEEGEGEETKEGE